MTKKNINVEALSNNERTGRPGLFLPLLLIAMSAYPPLATDMYLPALPTIVSTFNTTESTVNLTLVLFFLFFAFSTLVFGPISDKYGRKPALMVGVSLFTAASLGCVWASSVESLIVWRILQAVGAGGPVTISIAIVQDTYTGETKRKILAVVTGLMLVAPVLAPTLGSLVLMYGQWRIIFILLFLLGVFSLLGCLVIRESIPQKSDKTFFRAFGGLFSVMKKPVFRRTLAVFSLPAFYVLGFVGASAFIFMNEFGVSSNTFSLFFAANAVFAILGSGAYVPAAKRFRGNTICLVAFLCFILTGLLILTVGRSSALIFLLCVIPGSFMSGLLRPFSIGMMMDAGAPESGSASSMVNFFFIILGSVGIQILAQDWSSRALAFGAASLTVGVVCLLLWLRIRAAIAGSAGN